ncbi:hypothetical protein HDU67_009540, partial [Dinochytrium kinnereticum]
MDALVHMVQDLAGWKPVLTHKSGPVVYKRTRHVSKDHVPIFMGVGVIRNVSPDVIFTLVKSRSLWDEWYHEGHLVEKISDNTFLSYMVIRAISKAIASHRDLALLEHREIDPITNTIRIVSSSVETPKIPPVPTRIRANLKLNGWILDPQVSSDGRVSTRVSYIIQSDVKGMVPSGLAKRYLARRALVVVWLDEYLRKWGPPPVHSPSVPPLLSSGASSLGGGFEEIVHRFAPTGSGSRQRQEVEQAVSSPEYQRGATVPSLGRSIEEEFRRSRRPSTDLPNDRAYNSELIEAEESHNGFNSDDEEEGEEEQDTHPLPQLDIPPPPSPPTHRHAEVARKAVEKLRSLMPLDGWDAHSNADGISITTRAVEGASMPMVRGDGVVEGPWSVLEVLSVVKSVGARMTWDPRFESGRTVQTYTLDDTLTHTQQRGTFPVSGRDLCCISRTEFDADGECIYQVAASVVDGLVPEDPKRVRAELGLAGWALRRVEGGVRATYVVQVDIKGTVPASLLKLLQSQTPRAIKEIQTYLQTHGPLPHLHRAHPILTPSPTLRQTSPEVIDIPTRSYSASLTFLNPERYGGEVFLVVPRRWVEGGVEVDVKGGVVGKAVGEWKVGEDGGVVLRVEGLGGGEEVGVGIEVRKGGGGGGVWVKGRAIEEVVVPVVKEVVKVKKVSKPVKGVAQKKVTTNGVPSSRSQKPKQEPPLSPIKSVQDLPPIDPPPPPFPTPAPHRHTQTLQKAITHLRTLHPLQTWTPHSVTPDGITITTLTVPNAPMPIVRGDGLIEGPWTLTEVLSVLRSIPARQVWDPRFEGGRVVEVLSVTDVVSYTMQKGTFPVAGREMVTVVGVGCEGDEAVLVAASVEEGGVVGDSKR